MKIAVTGSNGLLGQHLVQLLLMSGHTVVASGKGADRNSFASSPAYRYYSVDITDENGIENMLRTERPDVLVHAAAITQVDECELNREQCENVNYGATASIIRNAKRFGSHLLYVSTDFVFDGEKGNYSENDTPKPVSYYGDTKLRAEALVQDSGIAWSIVRTCLVYGNALSGTRNNIIGWVKQNLEQKKTIRVVNDQVRTPTYVGDLAKGIMLMIEKNATGIYHISGKDILTPYQMAICTANFFGLDKSLIEETNAAVFTQAAKRPPRTGFDISKARNDLGYEPMSFEQGLTKMVNPGR